VKTTGRKGLHVVVQAAALALALTPVAACAAEWLYIGGDKTSTLYIDGQSIKKSGAITKAWLLTNYSEAQTGSAKKSYLSQKLLVYVHCSRGLYAPVQGLLYGRHNGDGELVDMMTEESPIEYHDAAPGSFGDYVTNFVCAYSN
jgi:hypothetical protein